MVFPWKLIGVFFWFYQSNIDRNWITERIWSLIYQLNSNRRRQRKSKVSNPHLERSFTIVAVILTDRPLFRKRLQIHPEASSSRETTKIIKRKRSQFPRSVRNVKPDRQTLRENDRVQGKRLCDRPHCHPKKGIPCLLTSLCLGGGRKSCRRRHRRHSLAR